MTKRAFLISAIVTLLILPVIAACNSAVPPVPPLPTNLTLRLSTPAPVSSTPTLAPATTTVAPGTATLATSTPTAAAIATNVPSALKDVPSGCPSDQLINSPQDGLGDTLFPTMGNAGYDVHHYTLALSVDPDHNTITGTATLQITALKDLSAFNLDFHGFVIYGLKLDDTETPYTHNNDELVITPATPLKTGQDFILVVRYGGTPNSDSNITSPAEGWTHYSGGTYVAGEPGGAATWYPVNEHPCDKAQYTYIITVADPYTVAANRHLVGTTRNGTTQTFTWETRDPLASYLATISVGIFDVETQQTTDGVEIRHYFQSDVPTADRTVFDDTPQMLDYFSTLYGPYPFEAYGALVLNARLGFALETQTLSTYGTDLGAKSITSDETIAHELGHQWFGDSVSLEQWKDIWLNEAFGTLSQWLWLEHTEGEMAYEVRINDAYRQINRPNMVVPGAPTADTMFDEGVYIRGGLTLYALRATIGDDAFFRTLKAYTAKYKYSNASTADFIAIAEQESGQQLGTLFQTWLYGTTVPPLPPLPNTTPTP